MSAYPGRFTDGAYEVIDHYAPRHARDLKHNYVGVGHLLLGLVDYRGLTFDKLRERLGLDPSQLRVASVLLMREGRYEGDERPFTDGVLDTILPAAMYEASLLGSSQAGPEELLLAMLDNPDDPNLYGAKGAKRPRSDDNTARTLLFMIGVDLTTARATAYDVIRPHHSIAS